jgi:hypothetical protein
MSHVRELPIFLRYFILIISEYRINLNFMHYSPLLYIFKCVCNVHAHLFFANKYCNLFAMKKHKGGEQWLRRL